MLKRLFRAPSPGLPTTIEHEVLSMRHAAQMECLRQRQNEQRALERERRPGVI
ncbi:MAG: hypothetical protein HRU32_04460 [Rhodobacteraceae bacterium]|nr:hypothetical protein [Paracoccaceae bacterium]